MPWASLPPGPGSGTSWIAHPEAYTDGPAHAEPLDDSSFSVKSQTQEPDTWGGLSLEEDGEFFIILHLFPLFLATSITSLFTSRLISLPM